MKSTEETPGAAAAFPFRSTWAPVDTIAITLVTLIGAIVRFMHLSTPTDLVFDEVYYAKDACFYLGGAESLCETDYEITYVHPPLGKWLIAIGVRLFGFDSFGWRIVAVAAGAITILLLYLLVRALLHSTLAAVLASGLLAVDLLHFVQSRVSMLDIFVPMFGVAAFLFLVYDRERLLEKAEHPPDPDERRRWRPNLLDRPWRLAAGLAGGAATACKWSGGLILIAVIVLTVVWEIAARRERESWGAALRNTFLDETPSILLWLVVAPLVLYAATFVGRLDGPFFSWPWSEGSWLNNLYQAQARMREFHQDLEATHSYQSPPWSWLLLKRPVSYYFDPAPNGDYREIMATGSPFVWWSSILALVYTFVSWVRSLRLGDHVALIVTGLTAAYVAWLVVAEPAFLIWYLPLWYLPPVIAFVFLATRDVRDPAGLIILGFAFTYLPWLVIARSAVFIFYLLPAIPFMYLAVAYVATRIGESWEARTAVGIFATGAVGLFMFYLPLLTGTALPQAQWDQRVWIFDNCDPPPSVRTTITVTETRNQRTVTNVTPTKKPPDSVPPPGWCWI